MTGRRGRNEGAIYKRASDGLWVGSADLGFENGKRRRKAVYGRTRREAAEKLNQVLLDVQRGLPVPTQRQSVAEFLTRWLEETVRHTRKITTFVSYRSHVKNHLIPILGKHQLTKLTAQHVQSFISTKLATGLNPKTVRYSYMVLRAALEQAVRWNLLVRNVCEYVDPPNCEKYAAQYFTPEQARTFLQAVRGHRLEALWTVAISLGLRRAEALGLRWADVDLTGDEPSLSIRGGLYRVEGKLQILQPKTSTSTRNIVLPAITVAALRQHKILQLEERLLAGSRWQETGLVFTTSLGTPLEPRNVTRLFATMLEKTGLPRVRLHDMRHTAATLMLVQGIPVKVVSEILGHARSGITQDIYQHVIRSQQRDAASKMDAIFSFGS